MTGGNTERDLKLRIYIGELVRDEVSLRLTVHLDNP